MTPARSATSRFSLRDGAGALCRRKGTASLVFVAVLVAVLAVLWPAPSGTAPPRGPAPEPAMAVLERERGRLEKELSQVEGTLRNLHRELGFSTLEEELSALRAQHRDLSAQIGAATTDLESVSARVQSLQEAENAAPEILVEERTGEDPATDRIRAHLAELRLKEIEVLSHYQADSRPVRQVREELQRVEQLLGTSAGPAAQLTQTRNPVRRELEVRRLGLQSEQQGLEQRVRALVQQDSTLKAALETLSGNEVEISALERTRLLKGQSLQQVTQQIAAARTAPPQAPPSASPAAAPAPVPDRGQAVAVALLAGLGAALAAVFLRELTDDLLPTPGHVERRAGLSTLISLPQVPILSPQRALLGKPQPELERLFARLREHVLLARNGQPVRALAVTAAHAGAGTSTVAAHLAGALARPDEDAVLLVDLNFRNPTLTRVFQRVGRPGVTDLLTAHPIEESALCRLSERNLYFLGTGKGEKALAEAFDLERFAQYLATWKSSCRFLVIDLPPLESLTVGAGVAGLCDAVLVVSDAARTRSPVLARLRSVLDAAHARVLGAVLNRRTYPIPTWLYRRV